MNKQGFGQVLSEFEFTALKKGQKHGFEAAYRLFADVVYSLALHLVADKDTAADILQQVFEKLLQKAESLNGTYTMGGWLKQTTINECMMHFRRSKKNLSLDDDDSGLKAELIEAALHSDEAPTFEDESQALAHLSRLPTLQRSVVYFYAIYGYKHRDIAPSLGIDEANSRQLYHRAMKQLKSWLNQIRSSDGEDDN